MYEFGDVVLTQMQFVDTFDVKIRPALVLFEEYDNVVVAGITSNTHMDGINLTTKEGMIKESVIKLNYIFTVSSKMISRKFFHISSEKKKLVLSEFMKKFTQERNRD